MPPSVSDIWNARVVSRSGRTVTIDAANFAYNRDVPAGGAVSFGLTASPSLGGARPGNFTFTANGTTVTPIPTPTPTPTPTPVPLVGTLVAPVANAFFSSNAAFTWTVNALVPIRAYFASSQNPDLIIGSAAAVTGPGSISVNATEWTAITNELGPASVYYWTIGSANDGGQTLYAGWRAIADRRAKLLQPSNWTTLSGASTTLTWDAGSSAAGYALWIGSEPGGRDLYAAAESMNRSRTLLLPTDGRPVYARLWTMLDGAWTQYFDYSFITALSDTSTQKAQMVYPVQGDTLTSNSVVFSWDRGRGAQRYALWVGSSPGQADLFAGDLGSSVSTRLGLPTDGRQIYVRLWTMFNGSWQQFNAYTYNTQLVSPRPARMLTPFGGTQLTSSTTTFTWDAGVKAQEYSLWIGSTPGGTDVLNAPQALNRSATVQLPADGRPIYVRLWTKLDGRWDQYEDLSYVTPVSPGSLTKAQLTSPPNASRLASTVVNFSWNAGAGAQRYALWVGSNLGTADLFARDVGSSLNQTVNVPADGRTLYVRLWTMFNGTWQQFNTYTFTCPFVLPATASLTSPENGTTLPLGNTTFAWSPGSRAQNYALWVGSSPGARDLFSAATGLATSATVRLPQDGRPVYAQVWTLIAGQWQSTGMSFFETSVAPAPAKSQLLTPSNNSSLTSGNVSLTWSEGPTASRYALWVGSTPGSSDLYGANEDLRTSKNLTVPTDGRRLYVRLWTLLAGVWSFNDYTFSSPVLGDLAEITAPAPGGNLTTASTTFEWSPGTNAQLYQLWVGSQPGTYDIYSGIEGRSLAKAVTLPTDSRPLFVQLWTMTNGTWSRRNSYTFTAPTQAGLSPAQLLSPSGSSLLPRGNTTFTWSPGTGATAYSLWIGSSPDANDLYSGVEGTSLLRTVRLPEDGRPIYVRLWTSFNGTWSTYRSYSFTTSIDPGFVKARLSSPVNGSRLTPGPVTFEWQPGNRAEEYSLHVGTTVGGTDIYSGTQGLGTSRTLTIPANGRPVYVRLWTKTRGTWSQYNDYIVYAPKP